MVMQKQKKQSSGGIKIAIILLAVLLILSLAGLAARYLYLGFFSLRQETVTVPGNLIGSQGSSQTAVSVPFFSEDGRSETAFFSAFDQQTPSVLPLTNHTQSSQNQAQAVVLELSQKQFNDNQPFQVRNMLPGDSVTGYFCVKAYHEKDITLYFDAEVTQETKSLGDVLRIKVTHLDTGKVLCDAPFSEIDGQAFSEILTQNAQEESTAYYQVDVSLDTSVGNEYQAAMLEADFNWYVESEDEGDMTTPPPDTGAVIHRVLWIVAASSAFLLLLLLFLKRRKEAGRDE